MSKNGAEYPDVIDYLTEKDGVCSLSGIQAKHANRLRLILGRLNASTSPKDMDLPGLKLHELGGKRKGIWSVWVSGNWRITFCYKDKDVDVVDYEDYH